MRVAGLTEPSETCVAADRGLVPTGGVQWQHAGMSTLTRHFAIAIGAPSEGLCLKMVLCRAANAVAASSVVLFCPGEKRKVLAQRQLLRNSAQERPWDLDLLVRNHDTPSNAGLSSWSHFRGL